MVTQWRERWKTGTAALLHDLVMIPAAWFGAYWLRFNLEPVPPAFWRVAVLTLPLVFAVQGASFVRLGLYRGVWRFASIADLSRILRAVAMSVVIAAALLFMVDRLDGVPRSVFPLDGLLLVALISGPRLIYRWAKDRRRHQENGAARVIIVGAGTAGELLARDLLSDPEHRYRPVAFVDDDLRKEGQEIHGIRVSGTSNHLPVLARTLGADLILIAAPTAKSRQLRTLVSLCELSEVPFRVLPRLQDVVSGKVGIKDLREVKIEDLLGREPVALDWPLITQGLRGKTILVTGGGGSIGAELVRQVARLEPLAVVILEQNEFNLYAIELELRGRLPDLDLRPVLGDVGDRVTVARVFREHRPDVVFHAAAYKHVPLLEAQVRAAAMTNVIGTRNVADAAEAHGCEAFVMISTDKAVNPTNIMGMTKRVAEIYCQHLSRHHTTRFVTVRFGNVLGSAGSVIPRFQQQIASGGPVTVTHPDIERYFMTIPEACQLILQAGAMGRGGEIFVLDMGEPVKIVYLAEQLIRLSGKKPVDDIDIVYTGLRPGEKMSEELFHEGETRTETCHPRVFLVQSRQVDPQHLDHTLNALEEACGADREADIRKRLQALVPEYCERATEVAAG